MSTLISLTLTICLAWSLTACSSGRPVPVLPDGLHRVPVNRVLPVLDSPTTVPTVPDRPVSHDGGR
ncbi:hypothetical protein BamIOP4010DRAFT_2270 [Burkholderia ambifaria IOP40-10]|uniref:Lipoprotein n=1 Tax=Burkholderia ambifaria IOP40-10 TaxID=396596 RepID=B1FE10_9BURK|nr:hypothetical protein [Burkholderia ambifaria]EDT04222.1 hypothetical protein BamIOP4010DRAFT_2270 [Burkholderia ambifaria IOP40-10]